MSSESNSTELENKIQDLSLEIGSKQQVFYFYVKVVDCRGILVRPQGIKQDSANDNTNADEDQDLLKHGQEDAHEPFIEVRLNASDAMHKRAKTKLHSGIEWWAQTFRFKVKNLQDDWVALEVRDKGAHSLFSTWIGELQLRVRDFKDGKVHIQWYKLGKGNWKNHSGSPRGFVQLELQLLKSKLDRPFKDDTVIRETFEDWEKKGMPMFGTKDFEPTATHHEEEGQTSHRHFELKYPNMIDAEHNVGHHYRQILLSEHPTSEQLLEMKRLTKVNCLHNGHHEKNTPGKRIMIASDGTESSNAAFEAALKSVNPETDHLFVVTVREIAYPEQEFDEKSRLILSYKLWEAAAGILQYYEDKLSKTKINYTTILPEADDAREMIVALAKKYKADVLFIGKHKEGERRHPSKHFRSFERYIRRNIDTSFVDLKIV